MYYCKNCGEPYMTDEAVMCIKCGVAKGQGNNYCHNCGKPLAPDARIGKRKKWTDRILKMKTM